MKHIFPAARIYRIQHEINILSGRDSVACGKDIASDACKEACFDYGIAIFSEINELMDNFVWKHWSSEAKAGNRWQLVNTQNLLVELADLWLFVTSLCQCAGIDSRTYAKACLVLPEKTTRRKKGDAIVKTALKLAPLAMRVSEDNVDRKMASLLALQCLICLTAQCGVSASGIAQLYLQKAKIHKSRMLRGRKQHGDTLAEKENELIKIK